ncbi:hypothetical protein SAMN06265795_12633 [Noviherbaspirillum humi]|uniref:Phage regulatory protein CII (CP76) n=1 Tax=Noviherbaspirillum humi TaxID=1688639 RepID=A0A239LUW2_9BURK|nr:phage regulatory CII family protein [Noviherbaspirillum humi]SNT33593.1 hypothetical protein SAMN06265795_12633 [Noviherbaspirillum humi]
MTVRRSERSPEDLLYDMVSSYPGGVEAMAQRLGLRVKTLYHKLQESPTTREFSSMMHKAEEAGMATAHEPLQALCFRHGGIFLPIEDFEHISDDDILKGVACVMAQMGSMAGAVNDALDAGEICDRQMEKIEPKVRKSFAVMAALWARIKGRVKRDGSKPRRGVFAPKAAEAKGRVEL